MESRGSIFSKKLSGISGYLFLFVIATVFLFYGLGDFRTLGSHEGYAAVPAQEMLDSGNWIVPRFGNIPRLQKPPLSYWVIAFTSKFTVGHVTEWTARFPSAIAAICLAIVMGCWAGKWYGMKSGFAAFLIQVTSLYVLMYGRKAEVDMLLCLMTTSALFLVATEPATESRGKNFFRWGGFFVLLSFSWLGKFHYGIAMVLIPVTLYFVIEKKPGQFFKFLHPVGLPVLIAAVTVWPYLVLKEMPEATQVWVKETVGRASGDLGHDPIWFYIPTLLLFCLPWIPFALYGIPKSFRKAFKNKNRQEKFIWIWLISNLLIISLQPMKHTHYVMAALPAMTLLGCQPLARTYAFLKSYQPTINPLFFKLWNTGLLLIGLVGVSIISEWEIYYSSSILTLVIFLLMVTLLMNLLFYKKAYRYALVTFILLISGSYAIVNDQVIPLFDIRLQIASFAQQISDDIPVNKKLWVYKAGMDPVVFYVDRPVFRAKYINQIERVLHEEKNIYVLVREPYLEEISGYGKMTVVRKMEYKSDSIQPKRNDFVLVKMNNRNEIVSN